MFTVRKIDHFFNMHGRTHSVANAILKPHRTRGESKYMLEEIYFSDICGDAENKDENGASIPINPQRAWFDNGKFRFQFPALWYQSTCNNKAIGLRAITVKPESVAFKLKIQLYKYNTQQSRYVKLDKCFEPLCQYPPNTDIMEILSDISSQFRDWSSTNYKNDHLYLIWRYNSKQSKAGLKLHTNNVLYNEDTFQMTIEVDHDVDGECGFLECFNTTDDYLNEQKGDFTFENVWNRQSLFVHASFVTGTSFQVLGEDRDFYPKPSKMYRFNGNSPDFYFELSYDGIHPQKHRFARFVIQLAYIFNDADYMAE